MDALIAVLSGWIAAQTGLSVAPTPRVEFVTPTQMMTIAAGPGAAPNTQFRALYSARAETAYLPSDWSAASLRDKSDLLHELVHHFQNVHKLPYQCPAAREALAYNLQVAWLKEQGVEDAYGFLQINDFYVVMISMCRDVDYE